MVKSYDNERKLVIIEQRNYFLPGDYLEVFTPDKSTIRFKVDKIYDEDFLELEAARHPLQIIILRLPVSVPKYSLIRRVKGE